jgi:hypothetical protein
MGCSLSTAGILPQPQRQTAVVSFTATAEGRAELVDLFRTVTERASTEHSFAEC